MSKKPSMDAQPEGFIKASDLPTPGIDASTKVALNRKGNELLNAGNLEGARRIFQTTGYSDGLSRVGDRYVTAGRYVDALKLFKLARDEKKSNEIIRRMALTIHTYLREEEPK